jgi:nucleotide-binding universal stress UspA family protein
MKKILIAIDGSPIAARAAGVGIELARSLRAEVAFIHVVDPVSCTIPEGGVPASELLASAERESKTLLADYRDRVSLDPPALEFPRVGKPADMIVRSAEEWPADMIVIGSHGRGGIGRLLLGSVAEVVMRQAPCPILVVRAQT